MKLIVALAMFLAIGGNVSGSGPPKNPAGQRPIVAVEEGQLVVLRPDGSGIVPLTSGPFDDVAAAQWSPDGTKVVFMCFYGGNTDVCTARSDGSGFRRLTSTRGDEHSPDWSPSGKRLAFIRGGRVLVMSATGDISHRVPGGRGASSLGWRWNRSIVFARDASGGTDLFRIRQNGTRLRRIGRRTSTMEVSPQWSFDGRRVVFVREGLYSTQIFVMRGAGGGVRRITKGCCVKESPAWSPSGKKIIYVDNDTLTVIRIDNGRQRYIAEDVYSPDWRK